MSDAIWHAEETGVVTPITDLRKLLSSLSPRKRPGTWVYAVLPNGAPFPSCAVATIAEAEGTTVVLRAEDAQSLGLQPLYEAAWITLEVHSSLAASGMVAKVAGVLAEQEIPCNVLAGYHHDHILVPEARAEDTLACLRHLQKAYS